MLGTLLMRNGRRPACVDLMPLLSLFVFYVISLPYRKLWLPKPCFDRQIAASHAAT